MIRNSAMKQAHARLLIVQKLLANKTFRMLLKSATSYLALTMSSVKARLLVLVQIYKTAKRFRAAADVRHAATLISWALLDIFFAMVSERARG